MTQEEKELLLVDLCARLPYGVWAECCNVSSRLDNIWLTHFYNGGNAVADVDGNTDFFHDDDYFDITKIKPYLRPMSSITEEEKKEYNAYHSHPDNIGDSPWFYVDWLNAHHFDYRGMIEKGLALEAPEGMYEN